MTISDMLPNAIPNTDIMDIRFIALVVFFEKTYLKANLNGRYMIKVLTQRWDDI
jgi:hypothetical protein